MQEIVKSTNQKMSSKQIAEKTGKEHSNVLRDIRNMLFELEKDDSNLNHDSFKVIKDNRGYDSEILLNERLSMCLASGYSISLRMRIIDDWAEMKKVQQNTLVLPHDFVSALKALVASEEAKQLAEAKVLEQQPKVDFYDAVIESTDAIDLGTAAKVLNLGYGRTTLFQKLRDAKVLMSKNQPYQNYIDDGLFRVVEVRFDKPDGTTHIYIKTLVFQKGLDFIRKKLS
jgi:anti-repressor protein